MTARTDMFFSEPLSKRLVMLRSMHSLTPNALAKSLNISTPNYLLMECGKSMPDYFMIRKLMNVYGCTSDYLLFGIMLGLKAELFKRLTDGARADLSAGELGKLYSGELNDG